MRQARTTATREQSEETVSDTDIDTEEGTETTETRVRTARTSRRGFGGYNNLNKTTFQMTDSSVVLAFLEPENFTYAKRHWIKYVPDDSTDGKQVTRVEYCLEEEDDCPLCEIGDKSKPTAFFNVVDISAPTKVLVWEATPDPTNAIQKEYKKLAQKGRELSEDDVYWVISREKNKNNFYTYSVDRISVDDMAKEWKNLKPLTGAQRDALRHRAYDDSYVVNQMKTRAELQEFVDSLG